MSSMIENIKFLTFSDEPYRINRILQDVDLLLSKPQPSSSDLLMSENAVNSSPCFDYHSKPMTEVGEPYKKKFICMLQYGSDTEFESIMQWTYDSSSISRKLPTSNHRSDPDELAAKQSKALAELTQWRRNLLK